MSSPHEAGSAGAAFDRQRAAMAVVGITGPEKAVLLVLAIMANAAGEAWPPIAGANGITAKASLGRRTVFDALVRLEALGLVSRITNPGKGTVYRLRLEGCASRTGATPAPVRDAHSTGAGGAPKQPVTTRPKKTSSSQVTREPSPAPIAVPDWIPADAWNGWLAMRQAKGGKNKLTPRAAQLAIETLQTLADAGHPPGGVLDQSTLNNWTGLFPIKDQRHEQRHSASRGRHVDADESTTVRAARRVIERMGGAAG